MKNLVFLLSFMLAFCFMHCKKGGFDVGAIKETYKALHHEEGPEEDGILLAFKLIGEHPELLKDILPREKLDRLSPKLRETVIQQVTTGDSRNTAICNGCVTLYNAINLAVTFGLDFETVRDPLVTLCETLTAIVGVKGNILCAPVADNYGPHIFGIIDSSSERGDAVCSLLNICGPEETGVKLQPRLKKRTHKPGPKPQLEKPKRTRRQAELIRFAHIADTHIEPNYAEGAPTECGLPLCCNPSYTGEGSAGPYGWYKCNVPETTSRGFLNSVAELDPAFVLYTGDHPPHALWEESQQKHMNVTRLIAGTIAESLPGKSVYVSIGNHEAFPTNLYFPSNAEIQELHQVTVEVFGPLAGWTEEQIQTVTDAGYYTQLIQDGLRLLVFNSNFGYTNNYYNVLQFGDERMTRMQTFMEETLEAARTNGEKVIFMTHHPIGDGIIEWDEYVSDISIQYQDVIVLQLVGHKHKDTWRLIYNEEGNAEAVVLAGPSMNAFNEVNPGFRIYYLDPETFEPVNYDQYFFDIDDAMAKAKANPSMEFMYTATEFYELEDITPASWQAAVDRMSVDDEYFQRWYQMRRLNTGLDEPCYGECRAEHLCELAAPNYRVYTQCYENNSSNSTGPIEP